MNSLSSESELKPLKRFDRVGVGLLTHIRIQVVVNDNDISQRRFNDNDISQRRLGLKPIAQNAGNACGERECSCLQKMDCTRRANWSRRALFANISTFK